MHETQQQHGSFVSLSDVLTICTIRPGKVMFRTCVTDDVEIDCGRCHKPQQRLPAVALESKPVLVLHAFTGALEVACEVASGELGVILVGYGIHGMGGTLWQRCK